MASRLARLIPSSVLPLAAGTVAARAQTAGELRVAASDPAPVGLSHGSADAWAPLFCGLILAGAAAVALRRRAARRGADRAAGNAEVERLRRALDAALAAREAAEEASRAKGELLASVSHEIRTPLNAVIGFADLLLTSPDLSAADRRSAERIRSGGDALLALVNDVLDFSQLDAGSLRLNARPFALPLLVDECIALVERSALAKKLSLRVELADRFAAGVLGDEARLRQILLNLLNNAIKFTDAGTVTLRIGCDPDVGPHRITFAVADTGVGIPAAELPGLFQRFRRTDGAERRAGTGLGLAISKALVERMGGTVAVQSREGAGSTFGFALDLPAAPVVLEAERPAAPAVPAARALRILLVEDMRINQELARAILEARGHEVDAVGDGADAIMAVEHDRYDLVLMDVQMPHVDGLTATRAIRRLPGAGRFVPVVAMTANVLREQLAAARGSGMDDVLAKPFSLEALDELLDRAARGAIRQAAAPDPATLAALAARSGADELERQLGAFAADLAGRFVDKQGTGAPTALREDARACAAAAARLGFARLALACGGAAEADVPCEATLDAVLREAAQAVAFVEGRERAATATRPATLAA